MASLLAAPLMGVALFLIIPGCLWPTGNHSGWGEHLGDGCIRTKHLSNVSKAAGIRLLSSKEQGDKGEMVICTHGERPTSQEVKIQVFPKHLAICLSMASQLF